MSAPAAPPEQSRSRIEALPPARRRRSTAAALAGEAHARLLAGPPPTAGPESLAEHISRLGSLPFPAGRPGVAQRAWLLDAIERSGLTGRGGGEFPVARKLATAASAGGHPLVVVNASEGEPASRKDRRLVELRPHLVLDGAVLAAAVVGAGEVLVYLEPQRTGSVRSVEQAILERRRARLDEPAISLCLAPARYVAGESSAVVSVLEGRGALPSRSGVPVAMRGAGGRPTLVSNVESLAHVGLVARFGAEWFRQGGSACSPGSTLVTLAGAVEVPGLVVELLSPLSGGELLAELGGVEETPQAVLLGGYGGRFVPGVDFLAAPVERGSLGAVGTGLGCGLVAVLPREACGLATTWRLLDYLVGESAGQCGPCVFGLPALALELGRLAQGQAGRRDLRRLHRLAAGIAGQGACGHPDGAVALLESALQVFAHDVAAHARGRPCGLGLAGWFPLPRPGLSVAGAGPPR